MMGKHQDNYKKKAQGDLLINDTVLKICLALLFFYMCPGAGNEAEYLQNCDRKESCICIFHLVLLMDHIKSTMKLRLLVLQILLRELPDCQLTAN